MRRAKVDRRVAAALILAGLGAPTIAAAQPPSQSGGSGLQVPRFVSLKSDKVNVRKGPGTEYPIAFVFKRAGLPVEVVREYEGWREVRDAEGAVGWVTQSLLSGRRTALVEPVVAPTAGTTPQVAIRSSDSDTASVVAQVEAGVIANVFSCDGRWCHVGVENFKGYLPQKQLWGIYEKETIR